MRILESYPITLPDWSICSLMYGDDSALDADDLRAIVKFEKWCSDTVLEVGGSHYTIDVSHNEPYFTNNFDLDSLAGNGIDCTLYIFGN